MHRRSKIRVVSHAPKAPAQSDRVVPFPVPPLSIKRPKLTEDELDAMLRLHTAHPRLFHWYGHVIMEGVFEMLLKAPGAPAMPMLRRAPNGVVYWEASAATPEAGGA